MPTLMYLVLFFNSSVSFYCHFLPCFVTPPSLHQRAPAVPPQHLPSTLAYSITPTGWGAGQREAYSVDLLLLCPLFKYPTKHTQTPLRCCTHWRPVTNAKAGVWRKEHMFSQIYKGTKNVHVLKRRRPCFINLL